MSEKSLTEHGVVSAATEWELFSGKRFLNVIRWEFLMRRREWLLWLIPAPILFGLAQMLNLLWGKNLSDGSSIFGFGLLIGVLAGSAGLAPLHRQNAALFRFLLPASQLEKYLATLLIWLPGFVLTLAALLVAETALFSVLGLLAKNSSGWVLFVPWRMANLESIATFVTIHSVFWCGSVYFRPPAAILTAIWAGLYLFIALVGGMMVVFATHSMVEIGSVFSWLELVNMGTALRSGTVTQWVWLILRIVVPISLYAVAYVKTTEMEAR